MADPKDKQGGIGPLVGLFFLVMIISQLVRNCSSPPVQQSPVYVPVPQQSAPSPVNPFNTPTPEYGVNGGAKCTTNQDPVSGEIKTICVPN